MLNKWLWTAVKNVLKMHSCVYSVLYNSVKKWQVTLYYFTSLKFCMVKVVYEKHVKYNKPTHIVGHVYDVTA